jgi:hypothetical protein
VRRCAFPFSLLPDCLFPDCLLTGACPSNCLGGWSPQRCAFATYSRLGSRSGGPRRAESLRLASPAQRPWRAHSAPRDHQIVHRRRLRKFCARRGERGARQPPPPPHPQPRAGAPPPPPPTSPPPTRLGRCNEPRTHLLRCTPA